MGLVKPYIMLPFTIAGLAWVIWARIARGNVSFMRRATSMIGSALIAVAASQMAVAFFPKLRLSDVGGSVKFLRNAMDKGGSGYSLDDDDTDISTETTLTHQASLAPLALFTALYRPLIFEARNIVQLLNALETTVFLLLSLQVLMRLGPKGIVLNINREPMLVFCLIFVTLLSIGTALATSNLGTLSRYRAPMIPMFAILLLRLRNPDSQTSAAPMPVKRFSFFDSDLPQQPSPLSAD